MDHSHTPQRLWRSVPSQHLRSPRRDFSGGFWLDTVSTAAIATSAGFTMSVAIAATAQVVGGVS